MTTTMKNRAQTQAKKHAFISARFPPRACIDLQRFPQLITECIKTQLYKTTTAGHRSWIKQLTHNVCRMTPVGGDTGADNICPYMSTPNRCHILAVRHKLVQYAMPVTFDQHLPRNQPTSKILRRLQFVNSCETQHGRRFHFTISDLYTNLLDLRALLGFECWQSIFEQRI